jgi:LuxR family maltose regulon positive regulatory protein
VRELDVLLRSVGGDEMIAKSKTQLLATKILPPQCAPGLIDRARLLDLIAQVQAKQVAVIQAGPGFGKTSLAVAWAERLQKSGKQSLDEPARFLFCVSCVTARERRGWRIGNRADFRRRADDLADIDDDIYLFLGDYHRITDTEIRDSVSYLLRYAPTQFHLVLTATGEPSLL